MEKCYICIPIAGRENDVFERADKAKQELINLGYEPICPLDLNKIGETELINHTDIEKTAWYMGKDIQILIEQCDAIYCCEGWKNSKGCNVERECAKQYNKKILYQIYYDIREDLSILNLFNQKRQQLVNKFCDIIKNNDKNTLIQNALLDDINKLDEFIENNFDIKLNKNTYIYEFGDN